MVDYMEDREQAVRWAKGILEANNWTILDTETTGLSDESEICQVATLSSGGHGWQVYVNPTISIPESATRIHGITDEDVKNAPTICDTILPLLRNIGTDELIIYNAEYDLKLITQSLRRCCGITLGFPFNYEQQSYIFTNGAFVHDAMVWYSQFVGEWNEYHGGYKWQRLPGGDHSALGDCKATLEIIKEMAEG